MAGSVQFYFDVVSPASYLAYKRLPAMVEEAGGAIDWRPFLLGGVFKAVGNASPVMIPAKGRWLFDDLTRWAEKNGVPFEMNPVFPINSIMIMRGAVAAQEIGAEVFGPYVEAMFNAMWRDKVDLSQPEGVIQVMNAAALPAAEIAEAVQDQRIKDRLRADTDEAVERGAFGAPTFFVGDEMHWGQDRLDWVVERLSAA